MKASSMPIDKTEQDESLPHDKQKDKMTQWDITKCMDEKSKIKELAKSLLHFEIGGFERSHSSK